MSASFRSKLQKSSARHRSIAMLPSCVRRAAPPQSRRGRLTGLSRCICCHSTQADTVRRLLRAAREAENKRPLATQQVIAALLDDHVNAAKSYIKDGPNLDGFVQEAQEECRVLETFLDAAQTIGEISDKSRDTIISKGEVLACRFMAAILREKGIPAQFVDLTDIVDFSSPRDVVDQEFYDKLAVRLGAAAKNVGNVVPVLTGYFGTVPGGLLKQIGRGYTDLCAALIAVGLRASELCVIKEVDGVFTADPRKVITAKLLPTITPAEAAELTFYGSEVIHPYTMEQVIRASIPIRIKNVNNPRGSGTTIVPDARKAASYPHRPGSPSSPDPSSPKSPRNPLFRSRSSTVTSITSMFAPKRPTAITIKHNILILNVHSNKRSLSHGFFARIFGALDKWKLSVDLISTSEVHVSMALHSESALVSGDEESKRIVHANLEGAVRELQTVGSVDLIDGMAILSLVGMQMKNMRGIAGKMFSVLGDARVNIEMISQGMFIRSKSGEAQTDNNQEPAKSTFRVS